MEYKDSVMAERTDKMRREKRKRDTQSTSCGETSVGSKYSVKLPRLSSEQRIRLKESLKTILEVAKSFKQEWTKKTIKFDDRRTFSTFKYMLGIWELDWLNHVSKDDELNVSHQLDRLSPPTPSYAFLTSASNWIKANRYYEKSLSLKQLLSALPGNEFCKAQAAELVSFLDHLIMIQQEQRLVAYVFSDHLEQLRKCVAASERVFSSKVVDDDGDWDQCPFSPLKHPMDYYMCQQKHLFDSLSIMSRESSFWLGKLEASASSNESLVEQFRRILEKFIPKFKKSKELLDQYIIDKNRSLVEDQMKQLDMQNTEILDEFERCITDLRQLMLSGDDGVPVTCELVECFAYTINKGRITLNECRVERNISSCPLSAYQECIYETMRLSNDFISGYVFVCNTKLINKDSPLTYWRVLFETPLLNITLDLLCRKFGELTKVTVQLLNTDRYMEIRVNLKCQIAKLVSLMNRLLANGNDVLHDFITMHGAVAEITYMLGDAFTTGGAGMDDNDETRPGTSNKNDNQLPAISTFPWDNHIVHAELEIDVDDPQMQFVEADPNYMHGSDSDLELF